MLSVRLASSGVAGVALYFLVTCNSVMDSRWLLILALAFGVFLCNVMPLSLPRDSKVRIDAGVVVAVVTLLPLETVVLVVSLGAAAAMALSSSADQPRIPLLDLGRRIIATFMVAMLYGQLGARLEIFDPSFELLLLGALCGVVYSVIDMLGYLVVEGNSDLALLTDAFSGILKLIGLQYLAQVSVGIVMAITYEGLGAIAIFIVLILLLLMQHSFSLHLGLRKAYLSTVSALARVSELRFDDRQGHADNVARLSVLIGRRLGFKGDDIERLSLAALLHDIGSLGLEPDCTNGGKEQREVVAARGAEMMSTVEMLSDVAPIIRLQGEKPELSLALEANDLVMAQIIGVASKYDDLSRQGLAPAMRLQMIKEGAGTSYPSRVVRALERVLKERRYR